MEGEGKARPGRSAARAALWVGAGAVVLIAGAWMPIPGIDAEVFQAVRELAGADTPFGNVRFPLVGLSLGVLVAARVGLALTGKSESSVWRSLAFVVCIALAGIQALAIAFWAESTSGAMIYGDLVPEPGWRFRLTAVITVAAGAAVLWWIADRIDATRAATGALGLSLPAALLKTVEEAGTFGDALANGMASMLDGAAVLVLPLSMVVTAAALALRTPASWPVKVVGTLELRSSFDVVAVPAGIAALFSIVGSAGPSFVRAGVVALGTVGLLVLLRARVGERAPRRAVWSFAIALPALGLALVPIGTGAVTAIATFTPGPLAGEASYTIVLTAVEEFGDGEAQAMVDRLSALGASAELVSADARRIRIRVENAASSDEVLDALRSRTLAVHLVRDFPDVPLPSGISMRDGSPEGPCPTVRAWAPNVGCASAVEPIVAFDEPGSVQGEPAECRLHCLEETPVFTGDDVVDATVATHRVIGEPVLVGNLGADAAARFERVTADNVGRPLAIVLDGDVITAPVIRSAIPHGRFEISLGTMRSYEAKLQEAAILAEALLSENAIRSEWTLEAIEDVPGD